MSLRSNTPTSRSFRNTDSGAGPAASNHSSHGSSSSSSAHSLAASGNHPFSHNGTGIGMAVPARNSSNLNGGNGHGSSLHSSLHIHIRGSDDESSDSDSKYLTGRAGVHDIEAGQRSRSKRKGGGSDSVSGLGRGSGALRILRRTIRSSASAFKTFLKGRSPAQRRWLMVLFGVSFILFMMSASSARHRLHRLPPHLRRPGFAADDDGEGMGRNRPGEPPQGEIGGRPVLVPPDTHLPTPWDTAYDSNYPPKFLPKYKHPIRPTELKGFPGWIHKAFPSLAKFLPFVETTSTPPTWKEGLPPMTPDPKTLADPLDIFPEYINADFDDLPPPDYKPFPEDQLDQLYPPREDVVGLNNRVHPEHPLPDGSFVSTWKSPDWFHTDGTGSQPMPRVQQDFSKPAFRESSAQRRLREARRNAVRRAFIHAWQGYKEHAWGHDEVRPASLTTADGFQGWGASIIDSLETLLIMNLTTEYELCRKHVWNVDFRLVNGQDWAFGWRQPGSEDESEWLTQGRATTATVATFETGIRYLGGLVGAYDLSGDVILLERAKDLAKILGRGFDTASGMLMGRFDAGSQQSWFQPNRVSLAEVGSMTLELTRLSQITGDKWYFDKAQRALDFIEERVIPRSTEPPLVPLFFDSNIDQGNGQASGTFGFGAMADSYYEYLIKQHQLVGGATSQYQKLYAESVEKGREILFFNISAIPEMDLLTVGKSEHGKPKLELEHLTCFVGAMLGLGAKLLDRPEDMRDGERLTETCYWLGAATPSGVPPEISYFHQTFESAFRPHMIFDAAQNGPGFEVDEHLAGVPPGVQRTDGRYLGRPETAESVFYMYRLTGDRRWQDRGWRMFSDWVAAATAPGGLSSIQDVTREDPIHGDNMESFVFAETLKYFYLLFSEPDFLSLDDYVFTTAEHESVEKLGVRASGTDAQWHMRWGKTKRPPSGMGRPKFAHNPDIPVGPYKGSGGGRGMGGGGGRPIVPVSPNRPPAQ